MGALDGLRVIDFGHYLAGPLAAMWLAELGAEVIRVDPPGGPRFDHAANAVLQRSKRSLVADLHEPDERDLAARLAASADIVIESFRPGVMDHFGLGADDCLARAPRLIYCSIPGFPSGDPRASLPGWEGVVSAATGLYPRQGASRQTPFGQPGTDPVFFATPVLSSFAAIVTAHSVMAALIARERTGRGQRIQVPLFDAAFEILGSETTRLLDRPSRPRQARNVVGGRRPPHHAHYRCADGKYINLCLIQDRHMPWFANLFPTEWVDDGMADPERMRTDGPLQIRARARFRRLFASRSSLEWERLINEELGVPTAICQTSAEWLYEDPHARDSGAVIEFEDPMLGHVVGPGAPIYLSATPMAFRHGRRPLDADRNEILAELEATRIEEEVATSELDTLAGALEGVRVVDLTQVLAGPTASRILAQYGADVVKINGFEDEQLGAHFFTNNGKRSMLLDLKHPDGLDVLWRLVADADVFSQNFTKGVPERLGVAETDVRARRSDIIYSTVSAFGPAGRRAGYRGREELGQAVTGMQMRWGGYGEEPVPAHLAFTDYGTGHLAAFGILVALYHRMRTGEPQSVHASLAQTGTFHQLPFMVGYEGRKWDEPNGCSSPKGTGALDRLYQGGDGEWFYLAAIGRGDRERLSKIEGLNELGDDEFEVELELSASFVEAPAATWVERLQEAGIGAHALVGADELADSPGASERGLTITEEFPVVGRVRTSAPARRLSATPPMVRHLVGPPGHDTIEVLGALGLGDHADALLDSGAVRTAAERDEGET